MNINKEDLILLTCKFLTCDRYSIRAEEDISYEVVVTFGIIL